MITPEVAAEHARLRALYDYEVLDTPAEAAFDALTRAAASVCAAPMAAVSLVDEARQWFKSAVGLQVSETPRSVSFCDHAMRCDDLLVVRDTLRDPRFSDNALVTGEPRIRFYAGAAIRAPDGAALGALCVFDTGPRPEGLTPLQAQMLRVLADQVEPQLRLRRAALQSGATAEHLRSSNAAVLQRETRLLTVLDAAEVGWWDWDIANDLMVGNAEMARTFGLPPDLLAKGAGLETLTGAMTPETASTLREIFEDALVGFEPVRQSFRLNAAGGEARWISARGRGLHDAKGRPTRFSGVAVDITDAKRTEEQLRDADIGRELAMDAAHLGRFDHDLVTGVRYYDPRARQMFGFTLEQAQDADLVFSRIHPEDRQRVIDAQAAARNPERRGPYREVYRIIDPAGGVERWISGVGRTLFKNGLCVRFMGVLEDVSEAKRAEAHRQLMVNELNHRVKNTLALIQSLVDASLRSATDLVAARADVGRRIQALSRAHDLLTSKAWSSATVGQIVEEVVNHLSLPRERLIVQGAPVLLGPKPALHLNLALHELATNALKYGALSGPVGSIRLSWGLELETDTEVFAFEWVERDGPAVSPPSRRGFGSRLIERITAAEFSGSVALTYEPAGVCWRLRAPCEGLAERGRSAAAGTPPVPGPLTAG